MQGLARPNVDLCPIPTVGDHVQAPPPLSVPPPTVPRDLDVPTCTPKSPTKNSPQDPTLLRGLNEEPSRTSGLHRPREWVGRRRGAPDAAQLSSARIIQLPVVVVIVVRNADDARHQARRSFHMSVYAPAQL